MNTSILIRTDKALKDRFEKQAKQQGLSMTFLFKSFMETYATTPEIFKTGIDEDVVDRSWKSAKTQDSIDNLARSLELKWL